MPDPIGFEMNNARPRPDPLSQERGRDELAVNSREHCRVHHSQRRAMTSIRSAAVRFHTTARVVLPLLGVRAGFSYAVLQVAVAWLTTLTCMAQSKPASVVPNGDSSLSPMRNIIETYSTDARGSLAVHAFGFPVAAREQDREHRSGEHHCQEHDGLDSREHRRGGRRSSAFGHPRPDESRMGDLAFPRTDFHRHFRVRDPGMRSAPGAQDIGGALRNRFRGHFGEFGHVQPELAKDSIHRDLFGRFARG